MLKLGLDLSLGGTGAIWSPDDESSLVAWYKFNTGIGLTGSDVRTWLDSGTVGHDMVQGTTANQPAFSAGVLTFDPSAPSFLSLDGSQISLSDAFTIGIRLNVNNVGGIVLGDNTETGEFFKLFSPTKLRVKIDNATAVDLGLDSGVWGDGYMVVTRDPDYQLKLWWNGVEQTTATPTLSGTADIDSIGVRKTDLNPFDGSVSEIQVFSSTSTDLTVEVNRRLAGIV